MPGNTADVTLLLPVVKRLRQPFGIVHACIVADRGMISTDSIAALEAENIEYILGVRERIISASRTETARSEYVGLAGQQRIRSILEASLALVVVSHERLLPIDISMFGGRPGGMPTMAP